MPTPGAAWVAAPGTSRMSRPSRFFIFAPQSHYSPDLPPDTQDRGSIRTHSFADRFQRLRGCRRLAERSGTWNSGSRLAPRRSWPRPIVPAVLDGPPVAVGLAAEDDTEVETDDEGIGTPTGFTVSP